MSNRKTSIDPETGSDTLLLWAILLLIYALFN